MCAEAEEGLNLAISDVFYLSRTLEQFYRTGETDCLDRYSGMALRRVWGAGRFSGGLTLRLHKFPDQGEFDRRAREIELGYIASSGHARASVAEQYAALPFEG